jgi:hypothetical protein
MEAIIQAFADGFAERSRVAIRRSRTVFDVPGA